MFSRVALGVQFWSYSMRGGSPLRSSKSGGPINLSNTAHQSMTLEPSTASPSMPSWQRLKLNTPVLRLLHSTLAALHSRESNRTSYNQAPTICPFQDN